MYYILDLFSVNWFIFVFVASYCILCNFNDMTCLALVHEMWSECHNVNTVELQYSTAVRVREDGALLLSWWESLFSRGKSIELTSNADDLDCLAHGRALTGSYYVCVYSAGPHNKKFRFVIWNLRTRRCIRSPQCTPGKPIRGSWGARNAHVATDGKLALFMCQGFSHAWYPDNPSQVYLNKWGSNSPDIIPERAILPCNTMWLAPSEYHTLGTCWLRGDHHCSHLTFRIHSEERPSASITKLEFDVFQSFRSSWWTYADVLDELMTPFFTPKLMDALPPPARSVVWSVMCFIALREDSPMFLPPEVWIYILSFLRLEHLWYDHIYWMSIQVYCS